MAGFVSPKLPEFATVEEERLHRKQRLAAAYRIFGRLGFGEGVAFPHGKLGAVDRAQAVLIATERGWL